LSEYTTRSRVTQHPAVYDDVVVLPPSPTPLEGEPAPQNIQAGLLIVVSANFMVMGIVMGGMWAGGMNPVAIILSGIGYYTLSTPIYLALVTNVVTNMYSRHERETTERIRIEAWREIAERAFEWKIAIEETRQLELVGRRGATGAAQRVSPLNTFVPAIADGEEAQSEGARFASSLYDTLGRPDAKKLHSDGRLRGRMIGSKRGAGSRDAGRWLLKERIIKRVRGGYALNIAHYPTRDTLKHLL
jgi:hypothetical protein